MRTFAIPNETNGSHAEIAQLVEHNLAKVGVASSSLVFRSKYFPDGVQSYVSRPCAQGGFFVLKYISLHSHRLLMIC